MGNFLYEALLDKIKLMEGEIELLRQKTSNENQQQLINIVKQQESISANHKSQYDYLYSVYVLSLSHARKTCSRSMTSSRRSWTVWIVRE